jgi:potassium efflux system protein
LVQANPEAARASHDLATEALAAREADLETADTRLRVLRLMLESQGIERTMWEMRFAGYNSRNVETLADSERRLAVFDRRLSLWKDYQQRQLDSSPGQLELLQARIRNLDPDSPLLAPARARLAARKERDESILRLLRRIDQVQRLSQRWQEGLERAEHRLPFLGRVQNVFSGAGSFLNRLWKFELFTAEDTITVEGQKVTGKRSVTLSKVVMAIVILAAGVWLSQFLSRLLQPVIVRRFKIEVNQANLIRRWVHAFTVVCIVMFSLVSVKIPLTVFAFAGGALAIGLGFGMQTLLKNFVSGLILLFERPFRIGDVLEVDKQRGVVTEIGLRSSVLQLWDGTETLIPNSLLLENPVSNWTYSSRKVRFTIMVGAAYGTDTRRVIQLLLEVAERHGVVEKEPAPQAFMTDFADSALLFELRYWVNVINANASQVGSDLRQMILGSFTESGIVIAFPQRDLHLDATRPIPIEIIPPRAAELSPEPDSALPK